jgi:arginine/serine-rich splicing factor 4/5/6
VLQSNLMERTFVARPSELLLTMMYVYLASLSLFSLPYSQRGPDNYRRDERRDDRYRDNRDRYREERPPYRRERSRSPPARRDVDDRRPRSPPRREYEDRRSSGYERREERRAPEPYPREARDDRRRDERKRDEKDDRYEDRAPRYSNGDAAYRQN